MQPSATSAPAGVTASSQTGQMYPAKLAAASHPSATGDSSKGASGTANHAIVNLAAAARTQSAPAAASTPSAASDTGRSKTAGATPSSPVSGAARAVAATAAPVVAPPAADAKVPAGGGFGITSEPAGAAIFVDGEPRGNTPAQLTLPPGAHKIVVAAEHHKLLTRDFAATAGGTLALTLEPAKLPGAIAGPAGLKVRCRTHGELRILVDGADSGLSCPNDDRISVTPGPHKIGLFSLRTGQTHEVEHEVVDGDYSTRVYVKY